MEKKRTTENQIDIFYYPNRHTHSFCLSLYIKAGALYESDEDNGITHFLEHILFRNINHLMEGNRKPKPCVPTRGIFVGCAGAHDHLEV